MLLFPQWEEVQVALSFLGSTSFYRSDSLVYPNTLQSTIAIDTMSAVPLIDLSPWTDTDTTKYSEQDRQAVVDQVAKACREIGFFAVQHHAVDETVLDAAWTASR